MELKQSPWDYFLQGMMSFGKDLILEHIKPSTPDLIVADLLGLCFCKYTFWHWPEFDL
jgi:hypothetical protein